MKLKMIYSKPSMEVVVLKMQQQLLAGSGTGGGDIDDLSREYKMDDEN